MMDEPKSGVKKVKASSKDSFTDPASGVREIRCQIAKWQRLQTEVRLIKLKDHEHFEIAVSSAGKAYITCNMCLKKVQLGTKNNKFLVSNWTRHVGSCDKKKSHGKNSDANCRLSDYALTPSPVTPYTSSFSSLSSELLSSPRSPANPTLLKEQQSQLLIIH